MSGARRFLATSTAVLSIATVMALASMTPAGADTTAINFESFNLGSPNGQDGWQFTGPYDVAIADPTSFGVAGMGTRALRISNAVTSGSFGDWAFSKSLTDAAGESGAPGNGYSADGSQPHFEASFKIASAVPNAEQPGLQFSLAPDRGDGARMSFLRFNDTPGGINVTMADYIDAHPQGQASTCATGFHTRTIATGLSRSSIHTVRISMDFLSGPANDRVEVYVDGTRVGTGTSWEDYFRYCEGNPTRPVDSLIFQARDGAGTAPATSGNGFLIDDISLTSGPISTSTSTGSWTQYPQGGATQYQAAVQQPINTANTSNWSSKSKGGIPVMFKLQSRSGPAVFQSIGSDGDTTNDYAYMSFTPNPGLAFTDIDSLVATYDFANGDCHGGSLRWEVDTAQGNLFIYYGGFPNFVDCTTVNQSGLNMIGLSDARYDTSQFTGGHFYDTYAGALAILGNTAVQDVALVLDSGWGGDQVLKAGTTASVNGNTATWNSGAGTFTDTCTLPPATIEVGQNAVVTTGDVNEVPVQGSLVDNGNAFRVVDCKYQYVLSIPSLHGVGNYEVQIWINGVRVPTPASPGGHVKFDLK